MEHSEALALNATDRYLLSELTAAEADAFEEHYFDCAECSEELRVGMQFMEGGRKLVRETSERALAPVVPIASRAKPRFSWIPSAAAAMLLLAIGLPMMLRTQPDAYVADTFHVRPAMRSQSEPHVFHSGVIVFTVEPEVVPADGTYRADVRAENGKVVRTTSFTRDADTRIIPLTFSKLQPGSYELVIYGLVEGGEVVHTERFTVKR
jgi:hypothetical protein